MENKYSFLSTDGTLNLSTETQLVDFLAAILREEIVLEEPYTFADMLSATNKEEQSEEDVFKENSKFILGESEQMLRAEYTDEPKETLDEVNNSFVYLYDTLEAVYNDATSTYLDTHTAGEFDIATHILNQEIQAAKQSLVVAKILVTKALTNDLMLA